MNPEEMTSEEKIAHILCQLNRQFAPIHDSMINRVKSLTPSQLNSLIDDLPDFQTRADLQVWLANHD